MANQPRSAGSAAARTETSVTSAPLDELPLLMIRAIKAMIADTGSRHDGGDNPNGLTAVHGIAARYIDTHVDATVVELSGHLRVTKQSASEIVAALERAGYVQRRPHPVDGRARSIELTEAGAAGLARSRELWSDMVADWQALVGADDLATVARVLDAYLDAHPPAS